MYSMILSAIIAIIIVCLSFFLMRYLIRIKLNKTIKTIIIICSSLVLAVAILFSLVGVMVYFYDWLPNLCNEDTIERVFYDNKKIFKKLEITAQTAIRSNYKHELDSEFKHKLPREPLQLQARIEHYGNSKLFPYKKEIIDVQSVSVYPKLFTIEIALCGGMLAGSWNVGYAWISDYVNDIYEKNTYIKYDRGDSSNFRVKRISGNWFVYEESQY